MRCETCQGAGGGMVLMVNPAWRRWAVCADCGGSGIVPVKVIGPVPIARPMENASFPTQQTESAGC